MENICNKNFIIKNCSDGKFNLAFPTQKVSQDVSPIDESPSEPLTELLGESGDINQTDSYGRTVLHTLAADGNASLLELALAACPQVCKL